MKRKACLYASILELTDSSRRVLMMSSLEQEEKTKHDKSGARFFFYGQIEHDEYEKKKLK